MVQELVTEIHLRTSGWRYSRLEDNGTFFININNIIRKISFHQHLKLNILSNTFHSINNSKRKKKKKTLILLVKQVKFIISLKKEIVVTF